MVGSQVTNRLRLVFALTYLVILNLILFREPLPFSAGTSRWLWLGLSGIIGLALGDAFLFQSYVYAGTRIGILLLSLAPIFGSIIAWIFFDETLTALQIAGIVLALAGIGWVVMSHEEPVDTPHGHTRRGVIFRCTGRAGTGAWACPLETGNGREFFPVSGKCHSDACRSNFHLGLGGVRRAGKCNNQDRPQAPQSLAVDRARRFDRTRARSVCVPAGDSTRGDRSRQHLDGAPACDRACRSVISSSRKRLAGRQLQGLCWQSSGWRCCSWRSDVIVTLKT